MVFDMIAGRVHGAVQARDCRIVWTDGVLYICRSASSEVTAHPASEPKKSGGTWATQIDGKAVRFQPAGCGSCKARVRASKVGQMTVAQIVEAGGMVDVY